MSSEYFLKCSEWCARLPAENCKFMMPVFFKDYECSFEFTLEKFSCGWYYELYVKVNVGLSEWEPFHVKFLIGFQNEENFSLAQNTFKVSKQTREEMWCKKMNDFQSELPSDYENGNWIKFRFCFESMTEKPREDKCLQTSSYLSEDIIGKSLIEDLAKLLDTGLNHDAEIKCGQHSIKAHKNILCARSEVFKAMLQSDMVEGRTGIVKIEDMDVSIIQDFLRYLYTDKVPEMSFKKAKELYEASDKYAVQSLKFRTSEHLAEKLSPENVFECLEMAVAHSDQNLKDGILTFSLKEKLYLQKEIWLPVCEKFPEIAFDVCKLSHANVTEKMGNFD